MSSIQFSSTSVNVPMSTLWNVLMDNIAHPERYLPEITTFKVLKKSGKEIIRSVKTKFGEFIERITIDFKNLEISFSLLNHPDFTGKLISKIIPPPEEGGLVLLTFISDWQPKRDGMTAAGFLPDPKTALQATKKLAEGN